MKKKRLQGYSTRVGWTKPLRVMKLTAFLILILVFDVSASVFSQNSRISVKVENGTLSEIFSKIEEQSEFRFFYQNEQIKNVQRKSIAVTNENILELVDNLLEDTGLSYNLVDRNIIVFPESDGNSFSKVAQQVIKLSGKVTDITGESLPGVTVVVKGTNNGTITNFDGVYSLSNVPSDGTIQFSFVGMRTIEIPVAGKSSIDVKMEEDAIGIEEVVAVGYGTMKRSDLTGSISSLKGDDLIKTPVTSINQALVGMAPGVRVSTESGAPGASVTIRIRGMNSIQGNNDPLYVVDGIPLSVSISGWGDNTRNPLASINPNDVESIEILKDASAEAIYGSRGANGVVLITTKSGKSGKSVISFDSYYAFQKEMKRYDVLNAVEFAEYRNEAVANAGYPSGAVVYSSEEIEEFRNSGGTNWHDELIRTAPMQNYQLSISGGNDKTNYYISGNYFKQDGVIKASGYDRLSIKSNINSKVSDKMNVGLNISLSQSQFSGAFGNSASDNWGGGYIDIYYAPPTFPVKNSDGTYFNVNPLSAFAFPNPVENAMEIIRDQTNLSFQGNVFGEYSFTPNLKLKVILGSEVGSDNIRTYLPNYTQRSAYQGVGSQSHSLNRSYLNVNTLTYDKKINEIHDLNVMIGSEIQSLEYQGFGGSSKSYINNSTGYYSLQSGSEINGLSSSYSAWSLLSYIGRINYVFSDKYLFTLTGRMDGSSKFQGDNKWSFFPSAAVGWRAVNEEFIRKLNIFSNLKLRASFGKTGSQAIGSYTTLDLIGVNNQITVDGNNTALAYYPNRITSPDLKWETTSQIDVGVDFGFLDNRISITADYFYKKTTDLLLNVTIPSTTSFSSQLQNMGSMENQGEEFSITSINIQNNAFKWQTNFNISFLKNKVLNLGEQDFMINSPLIARAWGNGNNIGITKVGEPFGSFFVLQEDGIIDNEEELSQAPSYAGMIVGSRRYVDVNGDNAITADDRALCGNAQPKFIGGLTNAFHYKGFDLNLFLEWSYGNKIFNATRFTLERPDGEFNTTRDYYNKRWTGDGTSDIFPIARYNTRNLAPSDSYVEDGSYLRLKNITLGYSLNKHFLERLKIKTLRLYVTGTNLLTFTAYKGLDPDVNVFGGNDFGMGVDYSGYPTTKTYVLGLNIQF